MLLRSFLLLLFCASGCVIGHLEEGASVSAERVAQIVPGKTTRAEILEWFGAPQGLADAHLLESFLVDRALEPEPVVDLPFADVLVFRLTRGKLVGMIFLLYNQIDYKELSDTLVVFFDAQDRVSYYGFTRRASEAE